MFTAAIGAVASAVGQSQSGKIKSRTERRFENDQVIFGSYNAVPKAQQINTNYALIGILGLVAIMAFKK